MFFNVYLFLRQSVNRGGAEREGDTESETGSRLWAVSAEPDAGLGPINREIMTWAEVSRLTTWAPKRPFNQQFLSISLIIFSPFFFLLGNVVKRWTRHEILIPTPFLSFIHLFLTFDWKSPTRCPRHHSVQKKLGHLNLLFFLECVLFSHVCQKTWSHFYVSHTCYIYQSPNPKYSCYDTWQFFSCSLSSFPLLQVIS